MCILLSISAIVYAPIVLRNCANVRFAAPIKKIAALDP